MAMAAMVEAGWETARKTCGVRLGNTASRSAKSRAGWAQAYRQHPEGGFSSSRGAGKVRQLGAQLHAVVQPAPLAESCLAAADIPAHLDPNNQDKLASLMKDLSEAVALLSNLQDSSLHRAISHALAEIHELLTPGDAEWSENCNAEAGLIDTAVLTLHRVSRGPGQLVLSAGGLGALVHVLGLPTAHGSLCHSHAVTALQYLISSQPSAPNAFVDCGGIPALVNCLKGCDDDDHHHAREAGLGIIHSLLHSAEHECYAVDMIRAGVLPVLVNILHCRRTPPDVSDAASNALQELAKVEQCTDLMLQQRIVSSLMLIIHDHTLEDPAVRCRAILLLTVLSAHGGDVMAETVAAAGAR
mmetsp:Transcript_16287/g.45363  ORF Transcript_16287/g.45363 Transcript_16287/m.45363 type:complete len:357 (-) Transcript_16287:466-1536(-)